MPSSPSPNSPEPGKITIRTRNFGPVEVPQEHILTFSAGLLGFPECRRYVLLEPSQDSPFLWLQGVDDPALAFVVMDPAQIVPGYQVELQEGTRRELGVAPHDEVKILVILTIPPGRPEDMTANLLGPLVLNLRTRRGRQLVLEEALYSHQHRLLIR